MISKNIEKIAADANVVLSAAVGNAARRVFTRIPLLEVVTVQSAYSEVLEYLPTMAAKYHVDLSTAQETLALLPIEIIDESVYRNHMAAAHRYVAPRDPDDVPLAALALALGIPIWSNDPDFDDAPIEVYPTAKLIKILGV